MESAFCVLWRGHRVHANICPNSSHSSERDQSHDVEQLANVSLDSFQQMDAGMEGGEEAGQGFTEYTHPAVVAGQAVS